MTTQLWIFSRSNMWWSNGKYIITQSIMESGHWDLVQRLYYQDTGFVLCKDSFAQFRIEPEWTPLSPEQVMRILDGGEIYSDIVGDRS
jgi:hypothetical protein